MKWFYFLITLLFLFFSSLVRGDERVILNVFHAGSLAVPFDKMERVFEAKYPSIDVRCEASGSVLAVRKVIDLHKPCDVIAVADYDIIPKMMFPAYTDHVKLFARNEIVLCYTNKSLYRREINTQNWYQILGRPNVKWAFANPNDDPCGYRTLMTIALSSIYYHQPDLLQVLLEKLSDIYWHETNAGILIVPPVNLTTKDCKIFVRSKSVELLGLLESGAIDYAFEYKSVAEQHKLPYLNLPAQINLSNLKHKAFYAKVRVKLANGKVLQGKPIVYGIASLKTAKHPKEARLWENFVTSEKGAEILKRCFQTPIFPAEEITHD